MRLRFVEEPKELNEHLIIGDVLRKLKSFTSVISTFERESASDVLTNNNGVILFLYANWWRRASSFPHPVRKSFCLFTTNGWENLIEIYKTKKVFILSLASYPDKNIFYFLLNNPTVQYEALKTRRKFYVVINLNRDFSWFRNASEKVVQRSRRGNMKPVREQWIVDRFKSWSNASGALNLVWTRLNLKGIIREREIERDWLMVEGA